MSRRIARPARRAHELDDRGRPGQTAAVRRAAPRSIRSAAAARGRTPGAPHVDAHGVRVRLYRMPAERAIATLPAGVVSVVITDPPYTSVSRSANGHLARWFPGGLSWPEIGRILAALRPKLCPDGVVFVMTNGDGLRDALSAMERAGFVRVRTVTWDRRYPGLGSGLRHQSEFVLVGYLPGSRTLSGVDVIAVPAVGPGTADRYPTEKPEDLGRHLAAIAGVGRGDVVLDPFCGSGALLVGAHERGATVIGCDIAPAALRRAAGKLGVPAPDVPRQTRARPAARRRSIGAGRPTRR